MRKTDHLKCKKTNKAKCIKAMKRRAILKARAKVKK